MYSSELVVMLEGHQSAARYLAARRIVSCNKQIRDHVDGFGMGQALAVCFGGKERGNEIASRVLRATCRQPVDVDLQLGDRPRGVRDLFGRHDEEDRAQCLGPLRENLDVRVWYTEQAAD